MSANDHLEDVFSGIFAKTEGVSMLEGRSSRLMCASVQRVRAPSSSLLLRAVADAHKSLLNMPSTNAVKDSQAKRAFVLPMRRSVEPQKLTIQLAADNSQETGDSTSLGRDTDSVDDKSEKNTHNTSDFKDKNNQFIVTMDGYHINAFLAKKLHNEGLLNDEDEISKTNNNKIMTPESKELKPKEKEPFKATKKVLDTQMRRLSNTNEESETQVIIKQEVEKKEKRKSLEVLVSPVVKKRKRSPIVCDVDKEVKETDRVRKRTVTNTNKYDSVPSLSAAQRKLVWCRLFPACRYGSACAFAHPRCKFLAACMRRNCVYSHSPSAPMLTPSSYIAASHVVPAANFKSKSAKVPSMCKFHPNCMNPACHFYHPKPCRYGNNCANKLECKFYHALRDFYLHRYLSLFLDFAQCRHDESVDSTMSANDHLGDVLSRIFAKTEGVSMLEGRSSRLMCASVERVRLRPRVRAPASSLLLRAVADAHKRLLNTPSTNADKDSQVRCALVLPMRRSVEPQKNTIQLAADNSQETGDSISLGRDMDSDAFIAKKFQTEGLLNDEDKISKTNNTKIIPPESKELKPKEKKPVEATKKVLDNQVQRLSNTSKESETQVIIKQEDEKKEKRKSIEMLDPPALALRTRVDAFVLYCSFSRSPSSKL
ncbi:unnamed protein product [Arctia plantaginis]|uniref:Zinc finger CCCH domain-containing protein 14 n=1 Tax=Arctia plantaginis TaxID=874455 RepID=A0A8S1APW8_ARCPL|nr:unnamed protein product [Arctia plantaginis]